MRNLKIITLKSGIVITYKDVLSCHLNFNIDGMNTSDSYFGEGYDAEPEYAPDYGCGNRKWKAYDDAKLIQYTLEKYNISKEDFYEICDFLSYKLSIGCCAYCA